MFLRIILSSLAAIILDNVIFTSAIGTSTLLESAKSPKKILSFGFFITEFSVLSSLLAYFAEKLLATNAAKLFLPTAYILCLGLVYITTLLFIWFCAKGFFKSLKKYVHLSAFNCAVLGCLFNNGISGAPLPERLLNAAYMGVGFMLATYILAINCERLSNEKVPKSFRGFPASVLYIGIISMVIYSLKI